MVVEVAALLAACALASSIIIAAVIAWKRWVEPIIDKRRARKFDAPHAIFMVREYSWEHMTPPMWLRYQKDARLLIPWWRR